MGTAKSGKPGEENRSRQVQGAGSFLRSLSKRQILERVYTSGERTRGDHGSRGGTEPTHGRKRWSCTPRKGRGETAVTQDKGRLGVWPPGLEESSCFDFPTEVGREPVTRQSEEGRDPLTRRLESAGRVTGTWPPAGEKGAARGSGAGSRQRAGGTGQGQGDARRAAGLLARDHATHPGALAGQEVPGRPNSAGRILTLPLSKC